MVINMLGDKCPPIHRSESSVVDDKDVNFINNNHKKEFEFWLKEKDYGK